MDGMSAAKFDFRRNVRAAIGRSENSGGQVVIWWAKSASLVWIGLTDLLKSERAITPSDPPVPTALKREVPGVQKNVQNHKIPFALKL